jgi:clan AA aspartic protease (TIGR02281 family)
MNFEKHAARDGQLPLGKIVIGVSIAIAIAAYGVHWFGSIENNKKADALFLEAKDEFRLEHLARALEKTNDALRLVEKAELLEMKADILINQNKVYEAEDVLKKLIAQKPNNAHYYYLTGIMAMNESDHSKAIKYMRQAIDHAPENGKYGVSLANLLYRDGNASAAETQFKKLIKADADFREAWQQYATMLMNSERYPEALKVINDAIQRFPGDFEFHFMKATTYDFLKEFQLAAKSYYRSLELRPARDTVAAKRYREITGKHVPVALEEMSQDQISFESRNNVMFIDAEVNHRRGRFLLDTGASSCVIFQNKAGLYGIKPGPLKVEVSTAGGTIQVPFTHASVELGRSKIENVAFGIIPPQDKLPADGIIGMNFLQNFHINIDKSSQQITLTH